MLNASDILCRVLKKVSGRHCQTQPEYLSGFSLFELLAVLAAIGIIMSIVVGSYSSWGTVHALKGAMRTLEAGLIHAHTIATTQQRYVVFSYSDLSPAQTPLTGVACFQTFVYTNIIDESVNEIALKQKWLSDNIDFEPVTRMTRLPRSICFNEHGTSQDTGLSDYSYFIMFRPDGSLVPEYDASGNINITRYINLETREKFAISRTDAAPLFRWLSIDPHTGFVSSTGGVP